MSVYSLFFVRKAGQTEVGTTRVDDCSGVLLFGSGAGSTKTP